MTTAPPDVDSEKLEQTAPWRDKELMKRLYVEEKMSTMALSRLFDCSPTTVREWAGERHGFHVRGISEAKQLEKGYIGVPMHTTTRGYEQWHTDRKNVYVHRLLAVAVYGFDAVADNAVHHENGVKWDNRPENIEVMDHGDHSSHHHTKIPPLDRVRIAELYENGDTSYRKLHEALDYDEVTWHTLMEIHKEFYGGA